MLFHKGHKGKNSVRTTTSTASSLTSTERHLVIRSCVLFFLQRQSSAKRCGVSSEGLREPVSAMVPVDWIAIVHAKDFI